MSNIVKIQQKTRFYAALETSTRNFLKKQNPIGQRIVRETILDHWRMGEFLAGVQEELRRRPGQSGYFVEWAKIEYGFSHMTVYRQIKLFKDNPNLPEVAENAAFGVTMEALLALPEDGEIRQTAMELAATGDLKTKADVLALVEASKPAPPASSDEFIATSNPPVSTELEPLESLSPEEEIAEGDDVDPTPIPLGADTQGEDDDPFADEADTETEGTTPATEPTDSEASDFDEAPTQGRFAIEFLIGDEVAGTTNKGDYIIGLVTSIYPDDADGRGMVFVKGEGHGACYTDQLSLATGQYLSGIGTLSEGQLVAWEFEGETFYGRFLESSSNPARAHITDFFDPSKQYEPFLKELGVRRWTADDRKAALAIRDAKPEAEKEPEDTLKDRVKNAEVVHDTLSDKPKEIPFEEWRDGLPIWRVLHQKQHKGIALERSLKGAHALKKSLKTFAFNARRAFDFESAENVPFERGIITAATMPSAENWQVHAPCRGDGCAKCGFAGYDTSGAGISPLRVESGEVTL